MTFLGWWKRDPLQMVVGDLQILGDEKVTALKITWKSTHYTHPDASNSNKPWEVQHLWIHGFVKQQLGNEKRAPGCLWYIGDYATQLYRDYNKPL